jgi:cyclophilin family peptidyl-prolyl cis-trans isomerase
MKKSRLFRKNRSTGRSHHSQPRGCQSRRPHFERLEDRWLLSAVSFNPLSSVTMVSGTTVYIPLNTTDAGQTVNYAVTASDYSNLTPSITPSTNKTVQMNVLINGTSEPMTFQLFDNLAPTSATYIENLVSSGFYNNLEIYRSSTVGGSGTAVIQGGNEPPTGAIKSPEPSSMAEEFNPNLQFTSGGLLALANTGIPGSSKTEFFITEGAAPTLSNAFLNYNFTIFGCQTTGTNVNTAIEGMPVETSDGLGYLVTPVKIQSASLITDTQNGVLELRAPAGITSPVTVHVTVTASDGTNTPTPQSFDVTIDPDTSGSTNPYAAVIPAAPSSLAFLPGTGRSSQSTNLNNSTSGKALQFQVTGVTPGNNVEVLADGNVIGTVNDASSSTVVVTTDGSTTLSDGSHTFTAIEVAPDQTVKVYENDSTNKQTGKTAESSTADVPSLDSAAVSLTVDTVAPTIAEISTTQAAGAYGAGTAIPITVTFSEPVTVTGTPQLALNAGSDAVANYTSGSGTATLTFTYTAAAGDYSSDLDYASTTALALNGGTIQDVAGNTATLTLPATGADGLATKNIVITTTVTGVSSTQATGAYRAGTAIPITVTFSEPVTVTGTPQLALNAGSAALATYSSTSTDGKTLTFSYTVAAGDNSSDLDYASTTALALNGGTIQDAAGHAAVLTLSATGTDGLAIQDIVVDTTAPTVTGVSSTPASVTYGLGRGVPITVTFSEPVMVTGTPQLALNVDTGVVASYTSGSGTATLTFTYTVAAGQNISNLDYTSTTALVLNGGTIQDAAGNAATLTLPATGTDGLATQNITINTVAPAVTAVSSTIATGTYGGGTAIPITVTFSKPVTVTGTPQLALNAGSGAVASYTSGSGTATLTFTYTVAVGQNISDLDYSSITALALNSGTIQDAGGNAAILTLPVTGTDGLATQNIAISTTPTVSVSDADGTYNGSAFTATATVTGVSGVPGSSLEGVSPTLLYYAGSDTSGTGSASAPVDVGTYTVVASFAGSTDYSAAQSQPVTFTIAQASLTITADNKVLPVGAPLPTLTFTSTGLVAGDSLTTQPTLSTTATTGSSLGTYAITISGATASSNYAVTLVNGTLTITADDTVGGYDSATSRFFLSNSNTSGTATTVLLYGVPNTGMIPLVGDWDGNGTETIGLYDPTTSDFYLRNSNSSGIADTVVCFGAAGCGFTPLVGDWTGDGTDSVGLYDPANSVFYLRDSNTSGMADTVVVYGAAGGGYTPIVGDWDGDGTDTVGLYNSTTSVFYLKNSNTTGFADETFTYGPAGAGTPIAGDWNGGGSDTVGLYYSATSTFSLGNSNAADATSDSFMYGPADTSGWTPLVGHWTGDGQGIAEVSSTQATGAYGAGTAIPITVTFNEPVTVTGTPQLALNASSDAAANYTSGSGTSTLTFTYTVAAGDNSSNLNYTSTAALTLNGGTIQDAAGNAAVVTLPAPGTDSLTTQNIVIDTTTPTVTAASSLEATGAYGAGTTIPVTVTFSEPVTVTGTPQLALNAGSDAVASYSSGSGTSTLTFAYTVAAGDSTSDLDYTSTTALTLNGGSIQDAAGNAATLTLPAIGTDGLAAQDIVVDTTAPTIAAVSSTQATGAYGAGTAIPITVTFSEPVTVTGAPQLALNAGSTALATYSSTSTDGKTLTFSYTVAAGDSSSDLDYTSTTALTLNGGSIQDAAGNAATLTLPTTGTDGLAAQNIVIDTTAPTVTAVSSTQATGAYGAGTAIPITVTFSEPVTVTGTPQLALNAGSTALATYSSTSTDGKTLTFSYTVAAGDSSSDLDYASTTALALNGGSIQDAAGNAATLTLPAPGTDGLAAQNITINAVQQSLAAVDAALSQSNDWLSA